MAEHDVKNLGLAAEGRLKIEWAEQWMPVLRQVRERFQREQLAKQRAQSTRMHRPRHNRTKTITL